MAGAVAALEIDGGGKLDAGRSSHEDDLDRALVDLREARTALLRGLRPLESAEFEVGRRGGWSIGRVAQHLVESDVIYAKLLAFQTGGAAGELPEGAPEDGPSAASMLTATQTEMLRLLEGIDADTLYHMTKVGHEEYSPLSLLENIAMHDGEHLAQLEGLLRTANSKKQRAKGAVETSVKLRPGTAGDLGAINEIYNHYIRETPITFDIDEWTLEQRRAWFEKFAPAGRHRLFVAEEGGRVIGFAGTGMFRPKAAYETTPETTIYCAPEVAGRGVGSRLYEALFDALHGEDIHGFIAGITLPNDASCRLHERFGFTRAGVMHGVGRKFGRYWDVAWYERLAGDGS